MIRFPILNLYANVKTKEMKNRCKGREMNKINKNLNGFLMSVTFFIWILAYNWYVPDFDLEMLKNNAYEWTMIENRSIARMVGIFFGFVIALNFYVGCSYLLAYASEKKMRKNKEMKWWE